MNPPVPERLRNLVHLDGHHLRVLPTRGRRRFSIAAPLIFLLWAGAVAWASLRFGTDEGRIGAIFGQGMAGLPLVLMYLHRRWWSDLVSIDLAKGIVVCRYHRTRSAYPLARLRLWREKDGTRLRLIDRETGRPACTLHLVGDEIANGTALYDYLCSLPGTNFRDDSAAEPSVGIGEIVGTLIAFFVIAGLWFGGGLALGALLDSAAGFVLGTVGPFWLLILLNQRLYLRSRTWPTVDGVILEAGARQGGETYLRYRYNVDGRDHEGNDRSLPVTGSQAGQRVTVYYDPKRPHIARLRAGATTGDWIVMVCATLVLVAVIIWTVVDFHGIDFARLSSWS